MAVTGTIAGDGTVGPVGGTGQKAAAVRDEGHQLFIVPAHDYEEAVARAGDDLKVVPVDNVDEALDALGSAVATSTTCLRPARPRPPRPAENGLPTG